MYYDGASTTADVLILGWERYIESSYRTETKVEGIYPGEYHRNPVPFIRAARALYDSFAIVTRFLCNDFLAILSDVPICIGQSGLSSCIKLWLRTTIIFSSQMRLCCGLYRLILNRSTPYCSQMVLLITCLCEVVVSFLFIRWREGAHKCDVLSLTSGRVGLCTLVRIFRVWEYIGR